MLFEFIMMMLSAVIGVEQKVDKKGREFLSLKFDTKYQTESAWIKTLVVYGPNKKGNITLLINHGGIRSNTGMEFPASTILILKPIKGSDLYLILKRGKAVGFATQYQVDKITAATPQVITTARYYEPGEF